MSKKVAIQGYAASFHDVAARQLISQDIIIIPCETFADVFACVADGRADVGVVAFTNSNFGSISESQSLVASQPIAVTGTLDLRIEQCLLGLPGASLASITEVYSHFVALGQCSEYLDSFLPYATRIEHPDTAGIFRWAKVDSTESDQAAIRQTTDEQCDLTGVRRFEARCDGTDVFGAA